jgi:hypothetical protein
MVAAAMAATTPRQEKLVRMGLQTLVVVEVVAARPIPTPHTQLEATAAPAS